MGLESFSYKPQQNNRIPGFYMNIIANDNDNNIILNADNQFYSFRYHVYVINTIRCTKNEFPFRTVNYTSGNLLLLLIIIIV